MWWQVVRKLGKLMSLLRSEPACPQCRMQMQSRRDCKRDSRFNRLMQQLYGDLHGSDAQVSFETRSSCTSLEHWAILASFWIQTRSSGRLIMMQLLFGACGALGLSCCQLQPSWCCEI